MREYKFHNGQKGTAISIRVITRGRNNEIAEILSDGTIKIRIQAPPVDDKANIELITFLAGVLEISKSKIEIVAGSYSRNKIIAIYDQAPEEINKKIIKSLTIT